MIRRFLIPARSFVSHNRVKPNKLPINYKPVESQVDSLKSRGFLRSQKAYEPQRATVLEAIDNIVKELGGVQENNFKEKKFDLLIRCEAALSHSVPNSQLYEIKNLNDVIEFYTTPVCCQTPYETLDKTVPNLHVIQDYKRFNPEEDGVSAFPKSSTLVTGLKYRKKYKGHIAKTSWP